VAQGGIVGWAAPLQAVLEAVLEALRPGAPRQEAC
jgi:hypothetical protein